MWHLRDFGVFMLVYCVIRLPLVMLGLVDQGEGWIMPALAGGVGGGWASWYIARRRAAKAATGLPHI